MSPKEINSRQINHVNAANWIIFCGIIHFQDNLQVIQRRDDFGEPRENFNRDWADYKNGFGDPAKEFWMGNENIYMLTNNEDYALRIELEDFEGNKRSAQFWLRSHVLRFMTFLFFLLLS